MPHAELNCSEVVCCVYQISMCISRLAVRWLAFLAAPTPSCALHIFDGVFSSASCDSLHATASCGGLGHTLYRRAEQPPSTLLEAALDSVLTALEDTAPLVEYWWRDEWKHIEAHADVDEGLAALDGSLRYPRNAHVLYLRVGEQVRGPTCVWAADGLTDLTTVPAVAGRLLRFDGAQTHAVPRPADCWLTPFIVSQPSTPPEDFCRSVVLFNTWPDAAAPPLDVPCAPADAVAPSKPALCAPRDTWRSPPTQHLEPSEDRVTAKVWLLGDEARRGQPGRTRAVQAHPGIHAALSEAEAVTVLAEC